MKKLLLVIVAAVLLSGCLAVKNTAPNKSGDDAVAETAKSANRTADSIVFDDLSFGSGFINLDRKLCSPKSAAEIAKLNDAKATENYKQFPQYAGYYLPKNYVVSVNSVDVDNDKKDEIVVSYTCPFCNAPPRGLDIIKNNKIIFTAQGGNLELKPIKGENSFYLNVSGLTIPRSQGYTAIKFQANETGEYQPVSEDDIKY